MLIDWDSDSVTPLCNPRLPKSDLNHLRETLAKHPLPKGHVCIATSGSTGPLKWVLLGKEAILASAAAVNSHLESTARDIWLKPLPSFHVGGLGILARACLSGAKVIDCDEKWNVERYFKILIDEKATLSALVPAQLYDLVQQDFVAPASLRAVLIGGGALPPYLYSKAKTLGWNVLPTYGMTECASQIATAPLNNSNSAMKVLPHLEVKTNEEGRICVRGNSLLTAYIVEGEWVDSKVEGWFLTEDLGEVDGGELIVHGRMGDFVKIGGENTNIARLNAKLKKLPFQEDAALFFSPDERLGHVVHLAVVGSAPQTLIEQFNTEVAPFERIRKVHIVDQIPRSLLDKLLTKELLNKTCN